MKISVPRIRYYEDRSPVVKVVREFMITFGGGMGGGHKYYYGEATQDNDDHYVIETLEGETIMIYKNFIVISREVKAVVFENNNNDNNAVVVILRTIDDYEIDTNEIADYYKLKSINSKIQNIFEIYIK